MKLKRKPERKQKPEGKEEGEVGAVESGFPEAIAAAKGEGKGLCLSFCLPPKNPLSALGDATRGLQAGETGKKKKKKRRGGRGVVVCPSPVLRIGTPERFSADGCKGIEEEGGTGGDTVERENKNRLFVDTREVVDPRRSWNPSIIAKSVLFPGFFLFDFC